MIQVKIKYSIQPSVHTNSLLCMHIVCTRVIEVVLIQGGSFLIQGSHALIQGGFLYVSRTDPRQLSRGTDYCVFTNLYDSSTIN